MKKSQYIILLAVGMSLTSNAAGDTHTRLSNVSTSHVLYADSVISPLHPVQNIVITVEATATHDPDTGLWTYSYSVLNEPISKNALGTFLVRPVLKPVRFLSPEHWMGFYGSEGDSMAVAWDVVDAGPDRPGWNGVQLYQGPYDPTPGQSVSGFIIVSEQPPTIVSFYAQGYDTLRTDAEEDALSAPGIFQEGVTGTTIGPDINSIP